MLISGEGAGDGHRRSYTERKADADEGTMTNQTDHSVRAVRLLACLCSYDPLTGALGRHVDLAISRMRMCGLRLPNCNRSQSDRGTANPSSPEEPDAGVGLESDQGLAIVPDGSVSVSDMAVVGGTQISDSDGGVTPRADGSWTRQMLSI